MSHDQLPRTVDVPSIGDRPLRFFRPAARAVFNRRWDVRLHGAGLVATRGAHIVAANHMGLIDGPLMAAYHPRPVHVLTKREMFEGRTGRALQAVGQIPLDRGDLDPGAIRACLRILRDGGVVGIFPEGTRGAASSTRPGAGSPTSCWSRARP